MTDLSAAAAAVVGRARRAEQIEAYLLHRVTTTVQAGTGGDLLRVGRAETRGMGVRVVAADREGYASTADLTDDGIARCLDLARQNATLARPNPSARLPAPEPVDDIPIQPPPATPLAGQIALAVALARQATTIDSRVRVIDSATYRDERSTVTLASTTGVVSSHARRSVELRVDVLGRDGGTSASGTGYRWGRTADEKDVAEVAAAAVRDAVRLLGPVRPLPPDPPLVLAPDVAAAVLGAAGQALTGPAVSGRGPFAARLGAEVAAPEVTLVDDGRYRLSPLAAPFDDEGVPRQRTPLVTGGALAGVLHSTASAAAAGRRSTGNARRGSHRSPPVVAPTTLRLQPTAGVADLLGAVPDAVYVQQLAGGKSGISAVTGRVDVGLVGCLLRHGEPAGPLDVIPLTTSVPDLLRAILAIGDDPRITPDSSVLAPTLLMKSGLLTSGLL